MSPAEGGGRPQGPGDGFDPFDPYGPWTRRRPAGPQVPPDAGPDVPAGPGGLSADQPPPSPPDSFQAPSRPRMHPALHPTGEHVAHSAIGSMVGGVLVWGGLGLLLDHWWGTGRALTAAGVVLGFLTGFYIVYVRFGRDE